MFNYEGYKEATPNAATYTVPDDAQLRGDFSNLRDAQGRLITIYDPTTGRLDSTGSVRSRSVPEQSDSRQSYRPDVGAVHPVLPATEYGGARRHRPVAQQLLLRPEPRVRHVPQLSRPRSIRTSVRRRKCSSATPTTSGRKSATPTASPPDRRRTASCRWSARTQTGVADWVRTVSSSLVFNVRAGLNQYLELARSDPGLNFNPAELGFPPSLVNQLPNKVFPRLNFYTTGTATEYQGLGRVNRNSETTTGLSLQPNLSWTKGKHNVRGGLDMRMTWYTREINNNLFAISFDRRFTQRVFNLGDALSGNCHRIVLAGRPGERGD